MFTLNHEFTNWSFTGLENNTCARPKTPKTDRKISRPYQFVNVWLVQYQLEQKPEEIHAWPNVSRLLVKCNDHAISRYKADSFVAGFNKKESRNPVGLWAVAVEACDKYRPGEKLIATEQA